LQRNFLKNQQCSAVQNLTLQSTNALKLKVLNFCRASDRLHLAVRFNARADERSVFVASATTESAFFQSSPTRRANVLIADRALKRTAKFIKSLRDKFNYLRYKAPKAISKISLRSLRKNFACFAVKLFRQSLTAKHAKTNAKNAKSDFPNRS
jgi:hypothetical protein